MIVFDIDSTLTESKQVMGQEIAELICKLLAQYKVAIISGAGYKQFEWQVLSSLACDDSVLKKLYLLPVDGTVMCSYQNGWQCQSDPPLSEEEKGRIRAVFENVFEASGLERPAKIYGELVEDRGAQLNFSALGQDAPIELKEVWDPDNKKRKRMMEELKHSLPGFSMRIGGTTSIEITRSGIDKAYGLRRLMEHTGVSNEKILYVGDKLFEGGNDYPVMASGIETRAVSNPSETENVIMELLEDKCGG